MPTDTKNAIIVSQTTPEINLVRIKNFEQFLTSICEAMNQGLGKMAEFPHGVEVCWHKSYFRNGKPDGSKIWLSITPKQG
jgi:hypothetical protein